MKIRPYASGDETSILDLDGRILPSEWNPRTLSNWKWKFTDANPAGDAFIWLAEHQGAVIAHFAAVPVKLKVFEQTLKGSHTIGALVEERYQNRGLLKLVADKLWEDLSRANVPLTWGLPNTEAYPLHRSYLGYEDLMSPTEWRKKPSYPFHQAFGHRFHPLKGFDEAVDRLWESASPAYGIMTVRDRAFLNWRYAQRPDWTYYSFGTFRKDVLRGYVILKLYREETVLRGHIVDIFAHIDDQESFQELIDGSLAFFQQHHVDEVTVWMRGQDTAGGLFVERDFQRTKSSRPLVIRFNTPLAHQDRVIDPSNWYFMMGDSTEIY